MMDLQTYLDSMVKAARADTFASSDQLSLGEIVSQCEAIQAKDYRRSDNSEPTVGFDFEYAHPTGIDSWRGVYAELALSFDFGGKEMSLSAFIEMCRSAIGQTFTGYKGGDYEMSRHTPVWVANYGNSGNTAVVGVLDLGYSVILLTGYREV